MANQAKTLLVAGMLTMAASTAFADNRAQAQAPAPQAAATQQAADPNVATGEYTGITKDGKQVKMSVSFKMLAHDKIPSPQFGQALVGAGNLMVMQEFVKYKSDELAANMPAIEKAIGDGMTKFMMLGVTPKGEVQYAKPGVNYATPVVTKVTDAKDGKVIYEKKADAPKAPAAKTAPTQKA